MKLFREDGHLTDEGLRALIAGELDEMGRLETAEHLDFCDQCVERYSELLTEEVELTPPEEADPEAGAADLCKPVRPGIGRSGTDFDPLGRV